MRITSGLVLSTFALRALAVREVPEIAERQVETVQNVLATVDSSMDTLIAAVDAFSGDDADIASAGETLIRDLRSGTRRVARSADLSFDDAVMLAPPARALQGVAENFASSLEAQVPELREADLCATLASLIDSVISESRSLIEAVVDKVPVAAQPVAEGVVSAFIDTLVTASDLVSRRNCRRRRRGGRDDPDTTTPAETTPLTETPTETPTKTPEEATKSSPPPVTEETATPTEVPTKTPIETETTATTDVVEITNGVSGAQLVGHGPLMAAAIALLL